MADLKLPQLPDRGGGIEVISYLLSRLIAPLARRDNSHLGPSAEIEKLLPTEMPVVHAPEFRTVRLDGKVQSIGVRHLIGLIFGFGVGDLDVIQCHDGASSKGLADTIKNAIILMVPSVDSSG